MNYEEIWQTSKLVFLSEITKIEKGKSITQANITKGTIPVVAGGKEPAYYYNESNRDAIITVSASGANSGFVNYFEKPIFASDCNTIISLDKKKTQQNLFFIF